MRYFIYFSVCMSIVGFVMAGIDKRRAEGKKWRVPEKSFFVVSFLGGSLGTFLGCLAFHHKTRHRSFMIGIPAIFVLETGIVVLVYFLV